MLVYVLLHRFSIIVQNDYKDVHLESAFSMNQKLVCSYI